VGLAVDRREEGDGEVSVNRPTDPALISSPIAALLYVAPLPEPGNRHLYLE
jgi:hypothetical protein